MILANQLFILGCVFFLVLVELDVAKSAAARILSLVWFGGLLMFFSRPIGLALEDIVKWWGERNVE